MKRLCAALFALFAGHAVAGPVITIDELGNATGAGYCGTIGSGLCYALPFAGVLGDVNLMEGNHISDIIFFRGNTHLDFYSDADGDHFEGLAGTGINAVFIAEVGDETNNGSIYTPLPGQPGYDASNPTYIFISNGTGPVVVPEPAALALLGLGLAGLGWSRRKRQ